jgi:hypothetical protein
MEGEMEGEMERGGERGGRAKEADEAKDAQMTFVWSIGLTK